MMEDHSYYSLHKREIPLNRQIDHFAHPFLRSATPYRQMQFSPSVILQCQHTRSSLSVKLAKMIVLGDCGVGKTAMVNR